MPGRNVLKIQQPNSYYHMYVAGINNGKIFKDARDYGTFLRLFERYLSAEEARDPYGASYPNFYNKLELVAYCLMPNHVHMLVYQHQTDAMSAFMRSVLTSYSRYFNTKYHRSGPLFASRYKASRISDEAYLEHVSRYIHLDPQQWKDYEYSSLKYFLQQQSVSWLAIHRIPEARSSSANYLHFMQDDIAHKQMLEILKHELANNILI